VPLTENLYNSRLAKFQWFVRRFGAAELVRKPVRMLLAPLIVPALPKRTFAFRKQQLEYFYHAYNMTWATERCIEVPIAREFLKHADPSETLEIGNVLSHYGPVEHDILDKFESGRGIMNQDILTFKPPRKYRLILSVSTFEHIGFDDDVGEGSREKILKAIHRCREFLQPQGHFVLTVPIGYNPDMDGIITEGALDSQREDYFKRSGPRVWKPTSKAEALTCRYRKPYPYANALLVAEIGPAG
jgi:hypothetical protein